MLRLKRPSGEFSDSLPPVKPPPYVQTSTGRLLSAAPAGAQTSMYKQSSVEAQSTSAAANEPVLISVSTGGRRLLIFEPKLYSQALATQPQYRCRSSFWMLISISGLFVLALRVLLSPWGLWRPCTGLIRGSSPLSIIQVNISRLITPRFYHAIAHVKLHD